MNRYTAYHKKKFEWTKQRINRMMTLEEAMMRVHGKCKYWISGNSAVLGVLKGTPSHFTHISPIKTKVGIRFMFSEEPVYEKEAE